MKNLIYIGNKLSKRGITTTVIETLGNALQNEGFNVILASDKKNKLLRILDMVVTVLKSHKQADYVLIDTYSTLNFYYALIISQLCRILKLKYIPILHGGNLPNRLEKSPFLSKLIFSNSYKNCAPSNYLLKEFGRKGFHNLVYIPNTIELNEYFFKQRELVKPNLLWVRSLATIYNPKMAIEVFYELKKDFPEATLCMVGPDKENLINDCKKRAKDLKVDVVFTGKLSKKGWTDLSKEYDVFINTTHFDNTPVSVIEAMALGFPIVSTNVGGIPYLLEDKKTAILVNDSDVFQMVNQIKQILTVQGLSNKLSINARKSAENFDWQFVKNKWIELLK